MFEARSKNDLIIEVWEKLDCESVGSTEIEAIEEAVKGRFGNSAVDSPMVIARLLADEGAELRHAEIMELYVERASDRPYDAALLNILDTSGLPQALASIRKMENLRRKLSADGDKEGLRLLRELALNAKKDLVHGSIFDREIAEWLTIWLGSPDIFENWIKLRQGSPDYISKFREAGNLER